MTVAVSLFTPSFSRRIFCSSFRSSSSSCLFISSSVTILTVMLFTNTHKLGVSIVVNYWPGCIQIKPQYCGSLLD